MFCLKVFSIANRVGVLSKSLHKYYVSPKPLSYKLDKSKVTLDKILYDKSITFLIDKVGVVTPKNENFLNVVYLCAMGDTLNLLLNSQASDTEKIELNTQIYNIIEKYPLLTGMTAESSIFLIDAVSDVMKGNLQAALDKIFRLSDSNIPSEHIESYMMFSQYVCAAAEYDKGWIFFKKLWAQFLLKSNRLDEARIEIDELTEMLPNDKEIQSMSAGNTFSISKINYQRDDNNINKNLQDLIDEAYASIDKLNEMSSQKYTNGCDKDFHALIEKIKTVSTETLLIEAAKGANEWISVDNDYYNSLLKCYSNWYGVEEFNVKEQGFVRYFGGMYDYLKQNSDNLIWLYESLGNYRSKYQLKIVLQHWLTFKPDIRKQGIEKTFEHYYDLDIIKCDENEVFVDCGAYTGDTIASFINQYNGKYKSIYGYELTPSTYKIAKDNLKNYTRVFLRNAGVAHENGTMQFNDELDAGNRFGADGNTIGQVVKLDDDIQEEITFIKMDIEGAEMAALLGASEHIKRSKPKLAISLYHKLPDLIDIPKFIQQFVPEYKFYFQHCPADFPFPTKYILLAVCENENDLQKKAEFKSDIHVDRKSSSTDLSNNSTLQKPTNYRSCNMINSSFLLFLSRIDKGLNCLTLCCEPVEDRPAIPFGNTPKESVENFIKMRKAIIEESINDVSADERVFSKGCLNCTSYQLGQWPENDLIHYVSFSMYPAPCQCKCFYCGDKERGNLNFTDTPEVKKGYEHTFGMLEYAKENGLIAPNAAYQIATGEISIHPYKDKILEFTKNQATIFHTNCFIFDEQIAQNLAANPRSHINFSIDSGTAKTWHKVKGVNNFSKVIENLDRYHKYSARKGQIVLKYIIFPGINDEDEDFILVIELMKRFGSQTLDLARNWNDKYSQADEENEKLIQSTARLCTMLYKNNLSFGMFPFRPIEREKIINQVAKNIHLGL